MFNAISKEWAGGGLGWPVCRRYECVSFSMSPLHVRCADSSVSREIAWALGGDAVGQHEVIGVWGALAPGVLDVPAAVRDLRSAGLEQVRYMLCRSLSAEASAGLSGAFRAVAVQSLLCRLSDALGEPVPGDRQRLAGFARLVGVDGLDGVEGGIRALADASPPGRFADLMGAVVAALDALKGPGLSSRSRRIVLQCDVWTEQLQDGLLRAIRRHGCFPGEAEALAFVERTLERELVRASRSGGAALRLRSLKVPLRFGTVRAGTPAGA